MVAGGIITTLEIVALIAYCTPCTGDDKFVKWLSPLVSFTMFCVTIWGSVVVFGKLNEYLTLLDKFWFIEIFFLGPYSIWNEKKGWEDGSKEEYYFCHTTPFMFAFVFLILQWIFAPLKAVLSCCKLGCKMCATCTEA